MTKRIYNNDAKVNAKRTKFDNDLEDLWGEDLDESVFDDFINQATQSSQKENESILSSYDTFKAPLPLFSSTQLDSSIRPTSSHIHSNHVRNKSENELQKLRDKCKEKEGEVSILRNQLREIKTQSMMEYQKSQTEWKNKLILSEKQVKSVKSELEFKNLEIANLKQKILSINKLNLNTSITLDISRNAGPSTSNEIQRHEIYEQKKYYAPTFSDYPLKNVLNDAIFRIPQIEKFVIENKLTHSFHNTIPYLQNKNSNTRVIVGKNRADVQVLFPIMLKLCACTVEEINTLTNTADLDKILNTGAQALDDLQELLYEIKRSLKSEDILEADSLYLKKRTFPSGNNCSYENQLGQNVAIVLNFTSSLLLYCVYVKDYFILIRETDRPPIRGISGKDFLNKLINILHVIGEIRKASIMSSFLISVIQFFTNICKVNGYANVSDLVCAAAKELIFLRPEPDVTFQLTYLFKEVSRETSFIEFLLNKSKIGCSTKKGILHYNQDACRFYIFVLIFDRSINGNNNNVSLQICLNLLIFIYNTYKSSYFLHHQDMKECECLPQLYQLEIELIFRMLEKYTDELSHGCRTSDWYMFFNNKIVTKVLNLMAFHCFELTEKYITVYSQFKEIEKKLSEKGVYDLNRLNLNEDVQPINSESFDNIGF